MLDVPAWGTGDLVLVRSDELVAWEPVDDLADLVWHPEKYSDDQPRDDHGRFDDVGGGGGGSEGSDAADGSAGDSRSARALATHKPSTAEKQRWAEKNEKTIAKMVKGAGTKDNSPSDVTTKLGGKLHGIEVKTMLDNGNDKITMHPASRERKEAWAKSNKAVIHTLVIDDRNKFGTPGHSGHRFYYRRGVGSFRLKSMIKVKDAAHLKQLMTAR